MIAQQECHVALKLLFLDESGDHNLKKINASYPVFVLGGVIVDRAYLREVVEPEMRRFKMEHFGRHDIVLHTVEMGRGRGDYGFLANPSRRASFYADLNSMLHRLEYLVVACVIRKNAHIRRYGDQAADPYISSLDILIEQFCHDLEDALDGGLVYAEKRNPGLDRDLMEAWHALRMRDLGTGDVPPVNIDSKIVDLSLKDKKLNVLGLQLADLVVTPIGRMIVGKTPTPNEVQWTVVESKLRRAEGTYHGHGLIIRPS